MGLLEILPLLAQESAGAAAADAVSKTTSTIVTSSGISLGTALAIVCSWERNKSILWALIAGIFSWLYVLYFAISRRPNEKK